MPATVTSTTVAGMLMMENRGGVKTEYISDPLGNLIQCRDMNGNKTYEAWYWSYGEIREETGTNPSPFGFCGTLGYYTDDDSHIYVRARYYRPNLTRWQTLDPIWPGESAYEYVDGSPLDGVEDAGTKPKKKSCPNGYKKVRITCYGKSDPSSPNAGGNVDLYYLKQCGGCSRPPRSGDCAAGLKHCAKPVCPNGSVVTILYPDAGNIRYCRICDSGQGDCSALDIFIPVADKHCGKYWKTGFYCVKCGY